MKLVHPDMEGQIVLNSWESIEWIIESPVLLAKVIQELSSQINGDNGKFVLSEREKILSIPSNIELVINPFSIDINDRKILNKLYGKLEQTAFGEEFYIKTQEMFEKFQEYFFLLEQTSKFMLETNTQADPLAWFKAFGLKFANNDVTLLERLCQYIFVLAELLKKQVIVFVQLQSYLSEDQIMELEKMAAYYEISLLFLENIQKHSSRKRKQYIIDIDGCEIF